MAYEVNESIISAFNRVWSWYWYIPAGELEYRYSNKGPPDNTLGLSLSGRTWGGGKGSQVLSRSHLLPCLGFFRRKNVVWLLS